MLGLRIRAILATAAVAAAGAVAVWPQAALGVDNTVLPPGFEETNLGENGFLGKPTHVAFAPDGRVFVVDEGFGSGPSDDPKIKVKLPGSGQYKDLFRLNSVNIVQDRGITGMALDKDFGTLGNNYMYLLYTYEHTGSGPGTSSAARTQRLTRVTVPDTVPPSAVEPAETVLLGSVGTPVSTKQACPYPETPDNKFDPNGSWAPYQKTDCIPSDSTEHAVNSVVIDPKDGTLWVSIGDGAAGGDFPDPVAFRAQAIDSLSGKLLHVDRNGKGLPGNGSCPGVTDFDRNCTKVYARGLRNPFRFSFRPDGKIALGDPGWKTREEIDLISTGGKNYGWPCYEGSVQTPLWKDRAECVALYAASTPHEPPIYEYSYPLDTFGAAIILGPTYQGGGQPSDYPDEYKGGLFFSDFVSGEASYLKLGAGGTPLAGYPKPFGELPDVVDWALAPDGDLVYVDIGFGVTGDTSPSIRKISAVDNFRPQAVIEIENGGLPYGDTPLEVDFDGSKSSDPDPGETATLSFAWDLDGDEAFDDSTAKDPSPRTYSNGSANVKVGLRVTDVDGKSDTATLVLYPGDNPPQVPSMDGSNPATYRGGETVELAASSDDPDAGDTATLHWKAKINHAGTHLHDVVVKPTEDNAIAFETDTVHDQPSTYEVTVFAEDERELASQPVKVVLQPDTQALTLTSTPSGAVVNHGGVDHTTPYVGKSTIGVKVGISAATSTFSGGFLHLFEGWSNGGPRSQTLTMPAGGLSLNAAYQSAQVGGGGDSGADPEDVSPATLLFDSKRGLKNRRRAVLRGTVRDPSGVRKVKVALRALRKEAGKCRWWSAARGDFAKRAKSCGKAAYMAAQLKGAGTEVRWVLPLGGPLPAGRYLVYFRTVDKVGNVGAGPGGKPSVRLRVRGSTRRARTASQSLHHRANR